MTDKELAEGLIKILNEDLEDEAKITSYGEEEITTFVAATQELNKDDPYYEAILYYCYELFNHEICKFCSCGRTAAVMGLVRRFLDCYDGEHDIFNPDKYYLDFPNRSSVEREFMLKWVDSIGLSDHGRSVYSSFLNERGVYYRELLRRLDFTTHDF